MPGVCLVAADEDKVVAGGRDPGTFPSKPFTDAAVTLASVSVGTRGRLHPL